MLTIQWYAPIKIGLEGNIDFCNMLKDLTDHSFLILMEDINAKRDTSNKRKDGIRGTKGCLI